MTTILRLGLANHGQRLAYEEFLAADYQTGFKYELIDGRLYVSPAAGLPHNRVQEWMSWELKVYARAHPDVINFVSGAPRVFVPGRRDITTPEPDVAAYHDYPLDLPTAEVSWEDVSPILVVEIPSPDDPEKDLVRNVRLYRQVPSIKEYWILDNREDSGRPLLQVHRRSGRRWRVLDFAAGETYTTRLLPGFSLILDPPR